MTYVLPEGVEPMIRPFESNGCSGGVSSLWRRLFKTAPPFEGCCDVHDYAYWLGGSFRERTVADAKLRDCIAARGYPKLAFLMWLAVRLFGGPQWPHSRRWGHGRAYRFIYSQ